MILVQPGVGDWLVPPIFPLLPIGKKKMVTKIRPRHGPPRPRCPRHNHALHLLQLHLRLHLPLHARRPGPRHPLLLRRGGGARRHGAHLLVHHASPPGARRAAPPGPHRRPGPDGRLQLHAGALRAAPRRQAPVPRQQPVGTWGRFSPSAAWRTSRGSGPPATTRSTTRRSSARRRRSSPSPTGTGGGTVHL